LTLVPVAVIEIMRRARRPNIERLVATYVANQQLVSQFQSQLLTSLDGSPDLMQHVHSIKARLKDPEHLRDKLERRVASLRRDQKPFDVEPENLLTQINDLAGIRILHLYTRQIARIDAALRNILDEQRFSLLEGPFARTWDDESRSFFAECGIATQESPSLYTSVHYVVGSASRTMITCEIQVRTLMEEVWGEVDHSMNYPHKVESLACREQLKVLARVTSSATRLVDSIFVTLEDHVRTASNTTKKSRRRQRQKKR
jgi:putative GTP pyrophosphokinase